jgi:topoisomerase-4 subunit A
VKGPDFPTGGILAEERANDVTADETGRGGFRVRAKWHREDRKNDNWQNPPAIVSYI